MAILCVAMFMFKKYGWSKTNYIKTSYRARAKDIPLDEYASKGNLEHVLYYVPRGFMF